MHVSSLTDRSVCFSACGCSVPAFSPNPYQSLVRTVWKNHLLRVVIIMLFPVVTVIAHDTAIVDEPGNDPSAEAAVSNALKLSQVYRPGLRNSFSGQRLAAKELKMIEESLRQKTGFTRMYFAQDGFLLVEDRTSFIGGSAAARELLLAAIDGSISINLQKQNRASDIVFARLEPSVIYYHWPTKKKIDVRNVSIDFSDFQHLRGDQRAMEAFDPGYALLHELGHAVLELRDPLPGESIPGDCEAFINRIRRELRVPERMSYAAFTTRNMLTPSGLSNRVAELLFAEKEGEETAERKHTKRYFLRWEIQPVGQGSQQSLPLLVKSRAGRNATDAP